MRVIVFFDLPMLTPAERRTYARFRRLLMKSGFMMLQQSVYCKLVPNLSVAQTAISTVKQNKPPAGVVQLLTVTEKQFGRMEYIVGECRSEVMADDRRVVIL